MTEAFLFAIILNRVRTLKDISIILRTAQDAREAFESSAVSGNLLADLYSQYNPDVGDVESFLTQAKPLFPALNCGIVSVYLREIVGCGEIVNGSYAGEGHTFLMIGSLVVDITADQFGGPSVYVGSLEQPWSLTK